MLGGHYLGEIRAFSVAPSVTSSPARELNDCVTVEGYVISDVITAAQGNRARQAVLRVPESDVISDVISSLVIAQTAAGFESARVGSV